MEERPVVIAAGTCPGSEQTADVANVFSESGLRAFLVPFDASSSEAIAIAGSTNPCELDSAAHSSLSITPSIGQGDGLNSDLVCLCYVVFVCWCTILKQNVFSNSVVYLKECARPFYEMLRVQRIYSGNLRRLSENATTQQLSCFRFSLISKLWVLCALLDEFRIQQLLNGNCC